MNAPDENWMDLYLAIAEFFGVFLVFSLVFAGLLALALGRGKLRRLIGIHRAGLRDVRARMAMGVLTFLSIALAAALLLAGCFAISATQSEAISEGEGPFAFLQPVAEAVRFSAGTQWMTTGNFVPWGCLLAMTAGIIAGAYIGIRLGRKFACAGFDLTRQLY